MIATAAKTHVGKIRVNLYVHGLTGIKEQRRRLLLRQVAAGMGLSGIKLKPRQICHDQPSKKPLVRVYVRLHDSPRQPVGVIGLVQVLAQVIGEAGPWYGAGAEAVQMTGGHLAVDQHETPCPQVLDQRGKTDLGRVVCAAEHGFAKKQLPHGEAVEASYEHAVLPYFNTVGMPPAVQRS